jgi:two-component system, response regulator
MKHPMPVILLVDDDDGHLMVAQRAITRAQLEVDVHVAHTGSEALRELGLENGGMPADNVPVLVMLDLSMPGVSGWDVLQRLRRDGRGKQIPVVVVSSSGRPEDVRRSYELGANSYLVKRYETARPGGYIADAARYWVELNVPSTSTHAS